MSTELPTSQIENIPISADLMRAIYKKCHFSCVYCGFDGRPFDGWMQLSIDHVFPQHQGGDNSAGNLVIACGSCNTLTNRMRFEPSTATIEIIRLKRERVLSRRKVFYDYWLTEVAPFFLDRPLPPADPCVENPPDVVA
jgi:5-methylcytosine-specific restriction endonuclease McrA